MYIPTYLPYPVLGGLLALGFITMLYTVIKYHRNYSISYNLAFALAAVSLLLMLLGETLKEFHIFLYLEHIIYIFEIITFMPILFLALKDGLPKALRDPLLRKLFLIGGIVIVICIIVVVVSIRFF
ncbi:hypothetical protein [Caproicibacter sp.]|uniref:hypothetical protein n=1 Tax=Caproicibacter sp. TaxID=2814884 RepID=UPI003989E625